MSNIRKKFIAILIIFAIFFTSLSAVMFVGSNFANAEGEDNSTEVQKVFQLQDGASAALLSKLNDEEDYVGLRWKTIINKAYYDSLNENGDLEFGTIIAPKSYGDLDFSQISKNSSGDWCITGTDKYVSVIPNDVIHEKIKTFNEIGEYVMYAAIRYEEFEESGVSIEEAFATELVAKAYVKITDGDNVTYEYSTADTVRSLRNSIVHDYIAGDYNEQPEVADKLKDFVGINEIKETSSGAKAYAFYNKGGNEEEFVELKGKEIIGAAINSTAVEATIDSETGIVTFGAINNYPGKNTAYLSVFTSDGDVYYKQINIAKGISTADEFVETFDLIATEGVKSTSSVTALNNFNGYYVLTDNIDFAGQTMPSEAYTGYFSIDDSYNICASGVQGKYGLTGIFDGNGYTIYNLEVPRGGVFGVVSGTIKNVAFININTKSTANTGLIANHLYGSAKLNNVAVVYGGDSVQNVKLLTMSADYNITLNNCYFEGNINLYYNTTFTKYNYDNALYRGSNTAIVISEYALGAKGGHFNQGNKACFDGAEAGSTSIELKNFADLSDNFTAGTYKRCAGSIYRYVSVDEMSGIYQDSTDERSANLKTLLGTYDTNYFTLDEDTGVITWKANGEGENEEGPKTEVDMTSTIITLDDDGEIIPFADGDIVSAKSNTDGVTASIVNNKVVLEGATADNKTIYSLEVETKKTIYRISAKYVTVYIKTAEELVATFALAKGDLTTASSIPDLATFDGYYLLASDITFTENDNQPTETFTYIIGNGSEAAPIAIAAFENAKGTVGLTGTFDGDGYTIYNLKTPNGGLFGLVYGTIKNVGFVQLSSTSSTGGILARYITGINVSNKSELENVYIKSNLYDKATTSNALFGGASYLLKMTSCYFEINVHLNNFTADPINKKDIGTKHAGTSSVIMVSTQILNNRYNLYNQADKNFDANSTGSNTECYYNGTGSVTVSGGYSESTIYRFDNLDKLFAAYNEKEADGVTDTVRATKVKALIDMFDDNYFTFDATDGMTWEPAPEELPGGGGSEGETPELPVDPDTPVDPEDPEDPETPVDPENPEDPETPVDPEDPEDPDTPVDPEDPETPVDPEDPETPVDPEDPEDPETPVDPEDPEDPETPVDPELPVDPDLPKTEVDMTSAIITLDDDGEIIPFTDGDIVSAKSNTDGVTASIVNNKVVLEGATADNKTIYSLEVETEKTIYKISAKYVTVYIKTAEEFVDTFNLVADAGVTSTNELAKLNTFSGYYLLANNIDFYGKEKPTEKFIFNSTNHYMASGAYTTAKTKGLTGTFDGNGYTLYNLKAPQGGLFGIISGNLKNVAFINLDLADGATGGMLAAMITEKSSGAVSNITNVYIDYTGGYKANKYVLANLSKEYSTYILYAYISAEIPMFNEVVYAPTHAASLTYYSAGNPFGTSVFIYVSKQSPVVNSSYRIFEVKGTVTTNNKPLWTNGSVTPTDKYYDFGALSALRFNSVDAEGDAYSMVSTYNEYAGIIEAYSNACFGTDFNGRIYWKNDYRLYSDNKLLENKTIALDTESNNETGLSIKDALGNVVSDGITYSIVDNKDGAIKMEEGSATITALNLGSATIVVKIDGIPYFTITVNVTKPVVDKTSIPVIIDADGESFSFEDGDIISVKTYADGVTASVVDNKILLEGATADNKTEYIIEVEEANYVYRLTAKYVTAYIRTAEEFVSTFALAKGELTKASTIADLATFDGYYLLANNIDFAGKTMQTETFTYYFSNGTGASTQIAALENAKGTVGLTGTFDGNGYTIYNLKTPNGGLFGLVYGTIKNVGFVQLSSTTPAHGILARYVYSVGHLENVYIKSDIYNTPTAGSALFSGANYNFKMTNCYFEINTHLYNVTSNGSVQDGKVHAGASSAILVSTQLLNNRYNMWGQASSYKGDANATLSNVTKYLDGTTTCSVTSNTTVNIGRYDDVSKLCEAYNEKQDDGVTPTTRASAIQSLLANFNTEYFDISNGSITWKTKAAEENQGGSQGGNPGGDQGGTEDDNQGEVQEEILVNLGIPSLSKFPNGEADGTIAEIHYFDGKLYLGMGNYSNFKNPMPIYAYDISTGEWINTGSVNEEAVLRIVDIDGVLYALGTDPAKGEGWEYGNYYKFENGSWVQYRELPAVVHCYDVIDFDGKRMYGVGSNLRSSVVYTDDDGKTYKNIEFYKNGVAYEPMDYHSDNDHCRVYDFFVFKGELFALHSKVVNSTDTISFFKYDQDADQFNWLRDTTYKTLPKAITTHNWVHTKVEYGDYYYFCTQRLYYTTDFNTITQITMPNGGWVADFKIVDDKMIILTFTGSLGSGLKVTLYERTLGDNKTIREIYSFDSDVVPTVMEIHEGYAYIGTGNIVGEPDVNNQKNGALIRIKLEGLI